MTTTSTAASTSTLTAAQLAASNGTTSSTTSSSSGSSSTGSSALASLSSNYSDFLTLLTTQLQNQDPTSPMDSSQFTSELVQFSGVEQQINTNNNLSQLISLTQAGNISQASTMLGATVTATSSQLPLQNGSATLNVTAPATEPVNITISDSSGKTLYQAAVNATAGSNTFTWDGTDSNGATLPDGAYNVSVTNTGADGTATPVPFTVSGLATSVDSTADNLTLNLGAVSVPFSAITSVNRPSGTTSS
jgi:flagellar basal-body rod modification protein FlgD